MFKVGWLAFVDGWFGLWCSRDPGCWVVWALLPGMPVLSAPRANAAVKEAGLALFEHDWKPGDSLAGGDGLGPVFNERSCVACHFQGGVGGGGDVKHNVASFEVHPVPGRPEVMGGSAPQLCTLERLPGKPDRTARLLRHGARRPEDRRRLHDRDARFRPGAAFTASMRRPCSERAGSTGFRARASCIRAEARSFEADRQGASGRSERHQGRAARACWPTAGSANSAGRLSSPRWKNSSHRPVPTSWVWATRMMEQAKPWAHGTYTKVRS